ncbi:hypothetical protein DPMN_030443 [Dreissena polymorpha]|uniref:Uncharacterized protein n=1 Tax=Dreissena polymorpha TaxID=45954 RepID=A0A9D4RI32_DREPO|nr:hypothetical protein DPMN_030443 [Dreissena polymorpha]
MCIFFSPHVQRDALKPRFAFDSRCSLRVSWTPETDADNTNNPDGWVVIEMMRVDARSVDLHSWASISPDYSYLYDYRCWSLTSLLQNSDTSVGYIESELRTVDLQGSSRYFENSPRVHNEYSPCQRRISSDTRIDFQRNTSGDPHILKRSHSSADMNRNAMSRQSCHGVRAAISHFDHEDIASCQKADTTISISACSSYTSIVFSASVRLSDNRESPHDSLGSVALASNESIAYHRSESNAEKE